MPHFIIDCSENIFVYASPGDNMQILYNAAASTELFADDGIKVWLSPYKLYQLGENKNEFMHVFSHIMEGSSIEQRTNLSKQIITALNALLPGISILDQTFFCLQIVCKS